MDGWMDGMGWEGRGRDGRMDGWTSDNIRCVLNQNSPRIRLEGKTNIRPPFCIVSGIS